MCLFPYTKSAWILHRFGVGRRRWWLIVGLSYFQGREERSTFPPE